MAACMTAVLAFSARHSSGEKEFTHDLLELIGTLLPEDARHCRTVYEFDTFFAKTLSPQPMEAVWYCDK
ncbi:MAG: hypothetical protein JW384_01656 [Nitrosomonadaceae bacterium]|nr:hypothetical protein [Nitrosomonadaceae bacterium]